MLAPEQGVPKRDYRDHGSDNQLIDEAVQPNVHYWYLDKKNNKDELTDEIEHVNKL